MSVLRYQMVIVWSDKDNCYLVHLPDFPEQTYRAQGNSYAEAAKDGEDVLQQLDRSAIQSRVVAEQSVGVRSAAINEAAVISIEPSIQSAALLSGAAIAPQSPDQTPPFPVLKTAFTSIATSTAAVAILTGLIFISEGLTLPWTKPSTTLSAEKSDADQALHEETNRNLEPAVSSKSANNAAKSAVTSDANTPTATVPLPTKPMPEEPLPTVPPLTLANSIAASSAVWAIAAYADEGRNINLIVSGEETGLITITDQGSGEPVRTIKAHDDKVRAIAIAPKSRRFISSSGDGIKVWNLQTGDLLYQLPSAAPVWSIAIALDESRFISGASDGNLAAWDLATGQPLYSVGDGATVWSVAVSPDGKSFVSGDSNRAVRQWDLATGQPIRTFTGHQSDVRTVAISPDGKTLASGSWDKTVKLWSLETGELKATLGGHRDRIVSLAISSDSNMLASGSTDNTIKLWNLSDYKPIQSLNAHSDWVLATAFKARERTLITGGKDKTIKVWE